MVSHGEVQLVRADKGELLIVEDVRYRPPRWSWEVQQISAVAPDALPGDLSPIAARMLASVRDRI